MASKSTVRTYHISKAEVLAALQGLAPIPTALSVLSFDKANGLILTGTMSTSPKQFVDTVNISVTTAEIAAFVNARVGTAFTAANITNVTDGADNSFYAVSAA